MNGHLVNIGGIVDHHCLNFCFVIYINCSVSFTFSIITTCYGPVKVKLTRYLYDGQYITLTTTQEYI